LFCITALFNLVFYQDRQCALALLYSNVLEKSGY